MSSETETFLLQVGTRIANARSALNLTQTQLAEEIGVDARSLQRIESGRAAPSLQRLREIADALNIEVSVLLDGTPTAYEDARRHLATAHDEEAEHGDIPTLLRYWERVPESRRSLALKLLRLLATEPFD